VITYTIHCYCISGLIFEKVRPNHSASPKSAPNCGSSCMQWRFMNHWRILHASNPTVLCVHVPIKLKVCLIANDFFKKLPPTFWFPSTQLTNSRRCTWSVSLIAKMTNGRC
jgi:hypothetical protein